MKNKILDAVLVGIVVAVVVILAQLVAGKIAKDNSGLPSVAFGAAGNLLMENYDPYVMSNRGIKTAFPFESTGTDGDITAGDDLVVTDDATISGGVLGVTTTNTATSTISVGCVQLVATSTASPIVLAFGTSFTGTTTLPTGAAASGGLVAWKFGSCPQ